jgi:hypothetical protein
MPLDIDNMLSEFEGKSKPALKKGLDLDSILSEFNAKDEKPADIKPAAVTQTLDGKVRPPISDMPGYQPENDTRAKLPTAPLLTSEGAYEHYKSGRALISEGVEDLGSGKPYKGMGKAALGALGVAAAPMSGIMEDTIAKPGNKIGPGFGDKANLVSGFAMPIVPGASAVVKAIPKNRSLSTLVENIGVENLPSVVKQLKENPRLAPADLSPRVLQDVQHLFANEGKQIDYLKNTSDARMASSKGVINSAYDTAGGVSVDLAKKIDDLAQASKEVGETKIQPTLATAKPVALENTLSALDNALKPGALKIGDAEHLIDVKRQLEAIRKQLRTSKEYDAKDLHRFQSRLRETADKLEASASGNDKAVGNALRNVRNNIVSDIDKSAPGFKDALNSYRTEMHIADAFRDGYDGLFSSSKKMENDPSFVRKWFDGLSEHEQQAAREGARAAINTEIGVARNPALVGERMARSDFNQEKLGILFGKEEADKLIRTLNEERIIANTHNKIVEGSQTAMRTASKSQFAMPTATQVGANMLPVAVLEGANVLSGGIPMVGAAAYTGARIAAAGKDAVKAKLAREHNAQYAKYALPTEGPSRDELIRALESHIPGPKQSLLTKAQGIARLVAP